MVNQIFIIVSIVLQTFLINGIISLPVLEKSINTNEENTNTRKQNESLKLNDSVQNSIVEEINEAVYFPPSNGNLMHRITMKIKNDVNSTKNCAIKVWRENSTETSDSPITIECDESRRKRRNVSSSTDLSPNDDDVKKFANIGVEKYAHTIVNSSGSSLDKILSAKSYPPGNNLFYKIKIHMNNCNGKLTTGNCNKMECIVYVWRERILEQPVSIECDPIRTRREIKFQNCSNQSRCSGIGRRKRDVQFISMQDPEIKKYVDNLLKNHVSPIESARGRKIVLQNFKEATNHPPPSQLQYNIKLRIGTSNCSKESKEENCVLDYNFGHEDCEINVYRATDQEPGVQTICSSILRKKRENRISKCEMPRLPIRPNNGQHLPSNRPITGPVLAPPVNYSNLPKLAPISDQ